MLKRVTVSNFKNFKDEISLDFSKIGEYSFNADCLSMRLIYGRNATGKTNFGRALLDIKSLLCGMQSSGLIYEDGGQSLSMSLNLAMMKLFISILGLRILSYVMKNCI